VLCVRIGARLNLHRPISLRRVKLPHLDSVGVQYDSLVACKCQANEEISS
jgi:hypothetical protein